MVRKDYVSVTAIEQQQPKKRIKKPEFLVLLMIIILNVHLSRILLYADHRFLLLAFISRIGEIFGPLWIKDDSDHHHILIDVNFYGSLIN